jgi:hypothetical protein
VFRPVRRYWDLIQRHKVTQFYTAPTAIRSLMRFGHEDIANFDRCPPTNKETQPYSHAREGGGIKMLHAATYPLGSHP